MIECIVSKNPQTADELCEVAQDCKKSLKGTQVGKHHKIMGAGGKCFLLINKGEKEFVSYEDVMDKKGHFGKLTYKALFEEPEEESDVDLEDIILDLKEKLTVEQLAELVDRLTPEIPNRIDFSQFFSQSEDFTSEIDDAKKWYKEIDNIDVIRAFGILEAIDVEFDSDKSKWDIKSFGYQSTVMDQGKVAVQFLNIEEIKLDFKLGDLPSNCILSRTGYGDALYRKKSDGRVELVIVTDSPRDVTTCRWL